MKTIILALTFTAFALTGFSQSRDTLYADEYFEVITVDTIDSPLNYVRIFSKNDITKDSINELIALSDDIKILPQIDSLANLFTEKYQNWERIKNIHFEKYRRANNEFMKYYAIVEKLLLLIP